MNTCIYCNKFIEHTKVFCNSVCKEKYECKIDDVIPRIRGSAKLTKKEIKMQEDFLKRERDRV